MRKGIVLLTACMLEIAWIALWLYALNGFRRDAVIFFEILIVGLFVMGYIPWRAAQLSDKPSVYGRLASRIEEWQKLQAVMRDEEQQRRRHGI